MASHVSDAVTASLDPSAVHVPTAGDESNQRTIPESPMGVEQVVAFKSEPYEHAPFFDHAWDATAAIAHLKTWAGIEGDLKDATPEQRAKFAKGFAGVRGDGDTLDCYVEPHHDVKDGHLVTVPAGVSAALARVDQVDGFSAEDKAAMRKHLEQHRDAWGAEKAKHKATATRVGASGDLRGVTFSSDLNEVKSSADAKIISTSVVQLAKCGDFKNHSSGPFSLNPDIFTQICANFARYKNDVPMDYEHASESPEQGGVFQRGAACVGWIVGVENRGDEGLFGAVEWVDPEAVGYIRTGKYRYLSPAIIFGATDPETGQGIGALLVSAALTNRPYLDGMLPVAASGLNTTTIEPAADKPVADKESTTMANVTSEQNPMIEELGALKMKHEQLMKEHAEFVDQHSKLKAKHAEFCAKMSETMGLPAHTDEEGLHTALKALKEDHGKLESEAEDRAKEEAKEDVEKVAARMGRKDDAALMTSLTEMRTKTPQAFADAFIYLFTEEPVKAEPVVVKQAAPRASSLTQRVAQLGGANPGAIGMTGGRGNAPANAVDLITEKATQLMRDDKSGRYIDPHAKRVTDVTSQLARRDAVDALHAEGKL